MTTTQLYEVLDSEEIVHVWRVEAASEDEAKLHDDEGTYIRCQDASHMPFVAAAYPLTAEEADT